MRSVQDHKHVMDLIRVNGDLGRLAGLYELWLTNEECLAMVGEARSGGTLGKIEAKRDELRAVIHAVLFLRHDARKFSGQIFGSIMIAKHIPMHAVKKSGFANVVRYLTDTQGKQERTGDVRLTNCIIDDDVELATLEVLNWPR